MSGAEASPASGMNWCARLLNGRALWSAIDAGATPLTALLLAAGLVRMLGASDYGLIVMALAVSALSTSISPAIAATTTRFVSEVSASAAMQVEVARVLTGSLIIVAVMDVLLLTVATASAGPLSTAVFGDAIASRQDIVPIMLLAVASLCVQQIDGVLSATLKGLQQFKSQAIMEVVSRVMLVVTVVATARLSGSVKATLSVYCASFAVSCVLRFGVVRRRLDVARLLMRPHASDLKRLLGFSGWMWLNAIASIAYGSVDRIIVGRVSGTAAMAEFSIYMQLAQLVHFVPAGVFAFTYPVFGRLSVDVRAHAAQVKSVFGKYFARCIGISFGIAVALLLFMRPLLRSLTAGAMPLSHEGAFIWLIVNFTVLAVSIIPYYAALGLGSARSVSLVTSLSMLASLGLTLMLTPLLGMDGAVFAKFGYSLGILGLSILVRRLIKSASTVPQAMASAS
jgi:O-antigen/teichoic acid export membrane protein